MMARGDICCLLATSQKRDVAGSSGGVFPIVSTRRGNGFVLKRMFSGYVERDKGDVPSC
jgi:hypothetical protein